MTPLRQIATGTLLVALLLALAVPAQADPTLAVPRTEGAPTHFGFAGKRPVDAATETGIAKTTPAPHVEAKGFGFARPTSLRFKPDVVTPTQAPCVGEPVVERRVVQRETTLTIDGRCTTDGGT